MFVEQGAHAGVGARAVVLSKRGGRVDAGEDRGLPGGALRAAGYAHLRVGRNEFGRRGGKPASGGHRQVPVQQPVQRGIVWSGQRVDCRIGAAQADAVEKKHDHPAAGCIAVCCIHHVTHH